MAKAAPAEQLRLLELQALDGRAKNLDVQAKTLRADPRLTALQTELDGVQSELSHFNVELADAQSELKRAEADVEQVVSRIDRDEARLKAGGLSKDLMALQADLVSLAKRRSDLEDTELEVMERVEEISARQQGQLAIAEKAQSALAAVQAEIDAQLAVIAADHATVLDQRLNLASTFDAGLLAIYDRTLERRGIGAARLFHGTSEGSGMQLSPGDLADLAKTAADEIVFCPDSGCILVRSSDWS
ncbi:Zn-ribbon protein, possibly nucleic acid-binding [Renibacterium salmoninarum ATCC 33209]|uniref:Zn-ribbon protein, possibly nucleic acid-binding n=1 Tax=Renibacterium salmoninarum (strain ATCC 33209 / DSM 20767 / JCM 11484 / NBRC 15589 / NCIMB 2235) TaxID=288705 RepID=A9WV12_RENSM|nr:C4-type zinc ribbon domain-containing protein [Renibacterium salmoninarum]ABY25033.1 Zn-ribbon protein, possibly nucleic acid-binding [Renibacterium salmoninarum ATCC 33209]